MIARRLTWRDALNLACLAAIVVTWVLLSQGDFVHDSYAYWSIDYNDMYGDSLVGRESTYLYSPAFAHVLWPATLLPWPVFASGWIGLNLAVLVWMVRPPLAVLLLFLPRSPVTDEISTGNIHLLLGAATVIGFRYAQAQALPLLTKVTPGVGVLWFAGAAKWRALITAIGWTMGISIVSFAIAPDAWADWLRLLGASTGVSSAEASVIPGPVWLRTLLAAALVVVGGWRGWRWTVPVAVTMALPVVWSSGLSVLVALVPLYRHRFGAWRDQVVGQLRRYRTSLSSR